jgi:hypothetical protein
LTTDPGPVGPSDIWPSLGLPPLDFCFRSLVRAHGLFFLGRVVLRHPLRATRGLLAYRRLSSEATQEEGLARLFVDPDEKLAARFAQEEARLLVAVGFCQKPLLPECPSGRPNHDCLYLERLQARGSAETVGPACARCDIREIGSLALQAGASMHIMTSALDIARDVMLPSIDGGRFSSVIMCLCPYSVQAIALPLLMCGLQGYLMGYQSGNCANWEQWLRADKGIKREVTTLSGNVHTKLVSLLEGIARARGGQECAGFVREGNIYVPALVGSQLLHAGRDIL